MHAGSSANSFLSPRQLPPAAYSLSVLRVAGQSATAAAAIVVGLVAIIAVTVEILALGVVMVVVSNNYSSIRCSNGCSG
ncbi:hypothetical protein ElyMa_001737000 [Elysia marginata]|uniref:Uncharacterized protein n=1 Tax=Elysia marginata TaxID=1093978 RepID=A0AAV4K077_9GAST|nr:hypothetical protein ElyMa_001737000 [Elysia marginata]